MVRRRLQSSMDVGSRHFNSFCICIIDSPVSFDSASVREGVRRVVNFHRVVINDVYPDNRNRLELLLSEMARHQRRDLADVCGGNRVDAAIDAGLAGSDWRRRGRLTCDCTRRNGEREKRNEESCHTPNETELSYRWRERAWIAMGGFS
jgi:hypothetical protein